MSNAAAIDSAIEKFKTILTEQLARIETMKQGADWINLDKVSPLIIGICGGDGIGPLISKEAERVLAHCLRDRLAAGTVVFKTIEGLTIENRAAANKAIPDDVLAELKSCHVILKGPTTTPQKGDKWPNIESANVAMRRELDLFGNVRPVRVPENGIDWTFFRENTEGEYVLGSRGFDVTPDLSVDFKVATEQGTDRIVKLAFEHARKMGKKRVTVVTKSNVVKTTDGRFSAVARRIAQDYPGISLDEWYIDIMTAKLLDPARRHEFEVMVLPNLYGDIITDEAAQIQGGVGTAGSANIGKRWSMFEAIHGSAPRMVTEGRAAYADPSSMIKAGAMLLAHIGLGDLSARLEKAIEICVQFERKVVITGREDGATAKDFTDYLLSWLDRADLETVYQNYMEANR
jgi:isocitrate dehydrogenase (NAD+)